MLVFLLKGVPSLCLNYCSTNLQIIMKVILYKVLGTFLTVLVLNCFFTSSLQAQVNDTKIVTITITSTDENGNQTIDKIEKTGKEASEEVIDQIVQEALKSNKSVDVEVEQTENLDGDKGITKTIEKYANREVEDGAMEIEIELDEEGNIKSEKIIEKEVRIIKIEGDSEEDIDIEEILEEHGVNKEDGERTQIRIIKKKEGEDIDVDQLLKEHGIDIKTTDGKQKKVKIIKKEMQEKGEGAMDRNTRMKGNKEEIHEEHTLIQITETPDEEVMIFQGDDGSRKIIKKKKGGEIQWTEREDVEAKLKKMGIVLPTPTPPAANYVNAVRSNKLIFMAGKGPSKPEGGYITGKVGRDLTEKEGYAAARLVGIAQLAALKAEIGDLNRVKRIVKVLGMVNATSDFTNHPEVVNGFSDFMVEVFGERGKHARAAVGMHSLPRNIAVEVEMIVEIE